MATYYTTDQVDEIGTFIAEHIKANSGSELESPMDISSFKAAFNTALNPPEQPVEE